MPRDRYLDDERDDRPRQSQHGLPIALIALVSAVLLVVLAGVGAAVVYVLRSAPAAAPVAVEDEPWPGGRVVDLGPPPRLKPGQPVVAVQTASRSVNQLWFGGDEHGATALVAYRDRGVGYQIDVVDTVDGKARGRVEFETVSINGVAVSPHGQWLVVVESAPSDGDRVVLYEVATGRQAGKFTPYGKHRGPGVHVPSLVWTQFIAPDRLLTISEASGFDVWSVPQFERLVGQPPRAEHALPRVEINGFTHSPRNFAVTRDGGRLILFNGTGFTFYDTRTAAATGQTQPFMKEGGSANFHGAAISADGTRFVCHFSTYGEKNATPIVVWEAPSGRQVSTVHPKNRAAPAGLAWWGPEHLVYWQGGLSSADIVQLASGDIVGKVEFREIGVLGTVPPTDGLWGITPSSRIAREKQDILLVRGAALPAFRPGARLVVGKNGRLEE